MILNSGSKYAVKVHFSEPCRAISGHLNECVPKCMCQGLMARLSAGSGKCYKLCFSAPLGMMFDLLAWRPKCYKAKFLQPSNVIFGVGVKKAAI